MDEVSIYNVVLSAATVSAHYALANSASVARPQARVWAVRPDRPARRSDARPDRGARMGGVRRPPAARARSGRTFCQTLLTLPDRWVTRPCSRWARPRTGLCGLPRYGPNGPCPTSPDDRTRPLPMLVTVTTDSVADLPQYGPSRSTETSTTPEFRGIHGIPGDPYKWEESVMPEKADEKKKSKRGLKVVAVAGGLVLAGGAAFAWWTAGGSGNGHGVDRQRQRTHGRADERGQRPGTGACGAAAQRHVRELERRPRVRLIALRDDRIGREGRRCSGGARAPPPTTRSPGPPGDRRRGPGRVPARGAARRSRSPTRGSNQDGCKGATVNLAYTVS